MPELKANKNNTTVRMSHLLKMTQRQHSMGALLYMRHKG